MPPADGSASFAAAPNIPNVAMYAAIVVACVQRLCSALVRQTSHSKIDRFVHFIRYGGCGGRTGGSDARMIGAYGNISDWSGTSLRRGWHRLVADLLCILDVFLPRITNDAER